MNAVVIIMRLVHITTGVFWAGTIIFVASFLEPSVRAAGPEGGKVMQQLMKRGFLNVMPVVGLLTVLSGLHLYARASSGFSPDWITSPYGLTLTIGAVSAIIGLGVGVFVMRPTVLATGKLGATLGQTAEGPERVALQGQIQALQGQARAAGRAVATLLGIAVICMAVARYL